MVAVKVCGITRLEDALTCMACGVDAIGFIFYPGSPRYIPPEKAREIILSMEAMGFLPPHEGSIFSSARRPALCGVFVNEKEEIVKGIVRDCHLDFVQFHGGETPDYVQEFPPAMVIKNFPLRTAEEIEYMKKFNLRAALVDAFHPQLLGGTGQTADWTLAREAKRYHPVILSGGLNAHNVAEAIRFVQPQGLDINSGVESSPGRKDEKKVREIMEIIRAVKD